MLKAHRLIEALRTGRVQGLLYREDAIFLIEKITQAEKFLFDFGDGDWPKPSSEDHMDQLVRDLRMPFTLCYFEIPGLGAVLMRDAPPPAPILFQPFSFVGRPPMWKTLPPQAFLAIDRERGGIISASDDASVRNLMLDLIDREELVSEFVYGTTSLAIRALMVLNCSNVVCVDNPVPADQKKKHVKRGHQPPFTYKTLHIKVPRTMNTSGNTDRTERAGPRLHLRRGHIRRLDDTRTTWVQPCMVGNAAHGVIKKDYHVTR